MKIAVVCICLSLFVASNAFILQDNMMRTMMTLNMMQGRNPFDFNSIFGGAPADQQQGQASSAAADPAAQGAAPAQGQDPAASQSGGLFSSPLLTLGLLGDGMFF